jgi:sugar phosphate permease
MAAWGTLGTYGLFLKPLLTEFGWTRAFTAGARSITSGISGLLGIAAGGLTDRFGPKIVLLVFGSFLGIGYLLMSQISSTWQYYATYGVFISLGISAATIPILITVARWFVKRRGLMTGLVQAGQGIGGMILAPVVGWLILNHGWRNAYLLLGITVLAFIIPLGLLLKRDPAQVGQLPYGTDEVTKAEPYNAEKNMPTAEFSLGSAVHTSQFWMLSIMLFAFGFCRTFILVHVPAHVTDMGFSLTISANVLAIIMGATLVTRVAMGRVADLIGKQVCLYDRKRYNVRWPTLDAGSARPLAVVSVCRGFRL